VLAFHQHLFGRPDTGVLASTFGGIANLSVLPRSGRQGFTTRVGFDCDRVRPDGRWCLSTPVNPMTRRVPAASGHLLPRC
jgi:hypothetical protein